MHQAQIVKLQDGKEIGFAEYGDRKGMPIFYFHGLPGSRLEAAKFNEDRPGMGLSPIDKKRTILSWATDVESFANCLGIEKFSIIGHSGGAPFVAACAYSIPERLTGAAIVSGMAPLEKPESKIGMARGQIIASRLIKILPWLSVVMMKLNIMMIKNPKMIEKMLKQLPEVDRILFQDPEIGKALINSTTEAFRNGIAGPAYETNLLFNPWEFELENLKCPITIWQGDLDAQAPMSHAKIYANLVPGAQLKIIENEGHLSLLQNHIEEILRGVC